MWMKILRGDHPGSSECILNQIPSVLLRERQEERGCTHERRSCDHGSRNGSDVATVKECQQEQETGGGEKWSPQRERHLDLSPVILVSDFWPPEL